MCISGESILIKVENDKIISAISSGKEIPTKSLLTIKGYFSQILELLKIQERKGSISIKVEYDLKFGYPTTITTERVPFAFDAKVIHYLSNFSIQKS